MNQKAKLIGIAFTPQKRGEMQTLTHVEVTTENGVTGDRRGKPSARQVTLMSLQSWQQACAELSVDLPWFERRANLLVDHLVLFESTGSLITIGDLQLRITGETDPCARMEQLQTGLFDRLANDWRGGVTCRVERSGLIRVGDDLQVSGPTDD